MRQTSNEEVIYCEREQKRERNMKNRLLLSFGLVVSATDCVASQIIIKRAMKTKATAIIITLRRNGQNNNQECLAIPFDVFQ